MHLRAIQNTTIAVESLTNGAADGPRFAAWAERYVDALDRAASIGRRLLAAGDLEAVRALVRAEALAYAELMEDLDSIARQ